MAEAGWHLPDRAIIKAKLALMDRLLRREHENRTSDEERTHSGGRQDGPSMVLRQRIIDVEHGETKGLCAEVKRLWLEARMPHKWPPPLQAQGAYRVNRKDIETASTRISEDRLRREIGKRSEANPDMPYDQLWDGTSWRMSNGSRRQVGLMTTARLGALVMNDSKVMNDAGAVQECPYCGSGYDNIQHALLQCEHGTMRGIGKSLEADLQDILNQEQKSELSNLDNHDKKMMLLGKQMTNQLNLKQRVELDSAVKHCLETIDDHRIADLQMNPMCGRTYTRPPEESMQQAALWDRMWKEETLLQQNAENLGIPKDHEEEAHEADGEAI